MRLTEIFVSVALLPSVTWGIIGGSALSRELEDSSRSYVCDTSRRLELNQVCDRRVDCVDGSDEKNCTYDACVLAEQDKFTCQNNEKCVLREFRCDGIPDCPDQSDEVNCAGREPCSSDFFSCADGKSCLPKTFMCDGHADCPDKSDESKETCHGLLHGFGNCKDRFSCGFGTCLEDEGFLCDGKTHCPSGRDESPETCLAHTDCGHCTYSCLRHPHGTTCTCNHGFELADDGMTCRDVDECARGFCSQDCKNTEGSFNCSCRSGFKLVNGTKCENQIPATVLWYRGSDAKNREIILEREGALRKYLIPDKFEDFHVSMSLMPPMSMDIKNEVLYIRQGRYLCSLDLKTSRPSMLQVIPSHDRMTDFAVDFGAGNVYYTTLSGRTIFVCQIEGACMPLLTGRTESVSRLQIVKLNNGTRLFWKEGSQIMSTSLDGMEIKLVLKIMSHEEIHYFVVDAQSNKMYVALSNLLEVDLVTSKTKLLANLDFNGVGRFFWNLAVHDDTVLVQMVEIPPVTRKRQVLKDHIYIIDRQTGDHLGQLETPAGIQLHSVLRTSQEKQRNPCWSSPCSHLCVPGTPPALFRCLCPPGTHLDEENERVCVPLEGEEQILFVNGSTLSTYAYENDQLFHNFDLDLRARPLAIASDLDMNLIYSTHQGLFALNKDGTRKEYGSGLRDIRTMVVDPTDDVLYAVNDVELIAISLKTSAVVLISNDADIIHMDIDPLGRVLFIETRDSTLYSIEIGVWKRVTLSEVPTPSEDGQKTWAFDPFERTIRTRLSLVINSGYCDITHHNERGFECNSHGTLARGSHFEHDNRLLARAGPPLAPSKGTACDSATCDFCVSAPGRVLGPAEPLEPVCICPFGHDLGADGVSCSKKCLSNMLRCSSTAQCIHETRRCDGHNDCSDGSDEQNCDAHNCGENFKCESTGSCISKKFVCDGENDCPDRSDEANCETRNCTAGQFACEDGRCISMSKKCDRITDCFHGDDETNCPKVVCRQDQFDCGSNMCISKEWLCDERRDCPNGEDEVGCPALALSRGKLRKHDCDSNWNFCCGSGEKLSPELRCNGEPDCEDRSDEKDCRMICNAPRFLCDTGACLHESDVCNGIPNCSNGADERNCSGKCQQNGLFECHADGTCIPEAKLCDGTRDCTDGSDEAKEMCLVKAPPETSCFADDFRCQNGQCISLGRVCDNITHCNDGSDEGEHCQNLDCGKAGCSHTCFADEANQVRCSCPSGYRLMKNGYSCGDIDECVETPEVCSQFCENTKGNYSCSCAPGFEMTAAGGCRVHADSGDPVVFVIEDGIVEFIKNRDRILVLDSTGSRLGDVEYDVAKGYVFVSDTTKNKIHRIPFDPSDPKNKREAYTQVKPGALALDWVTGNLYFADFRPSIHVCDRYMEGANCKVLTEVNWKPAPGDPPPSITSIALVPDEGIMFYSEASTGFIFRQYMDGAHKSTFGWGVREKRPLSLTVDHIHRTLYWIDARSGSIESSNFKGEKIRRIATHLDYVRSFGIFEDYVLFPEPEHEHWVIMHKQTGKIESSRLSTLGVASKIKIMHQVNQPKEINRCHNAPCRQLCLLKPHGFTCACLDDQELSSDNVTCVKSTIDDSGLYDEAQQRKIEAECSCENGAKCTASKLVSNKFYCKCLPGFHGKRCEVGATRSLLLTVVLICTFSILLAGAGIALMIIAARRQLPGIKADAQIAEGSDRRNLINEEAEDGPL